VTEDATSSTAPESAGLSRRAVIRSVVVLVLLAAGIFTVHVLEAAMNATFDKPPAPLRIPLSDFRYEIGSPVKYTTDGADEVIGADGLATLGTNDYLLRTFVEKVKPGDPHAKVRLNLNYYATGSSTPHVPEICWTASGMQEAPNSRRVFEVPEVKHADGRVDTVRMRMISFLPPSGSPARSEAGEPLYANVAYVFHVNGEYVATPQEVMSHFWSAQNKFAYHCKIEVMPMDPDRGDVLLCTQAKAEEIASKFIREALPAVEDCLPDPKILTQGLDAEHAEAGK
jgi:hypothetical protein